MKKLAFALLCMGSLVFTACGGDDEEIEVADASTADSGPTGTCNPVTQSGCDAGEKCAQIVERADDPATADTNEFLGRTACVPDGDKQAGEACSSGEPGPDGYDDCVAGYACNGVCVAICDVPQQQGCEETSGTCVLYENNFDDVGDGATAGLCAPSCDVATQTVNDDNGDPTAAECEDLVDGEGTVVREGACFLNIGLGVASCATVPEGATGATQAKPCYGPASAPDRCYLNGCAGGFLAFLGDPTMSQPRPLCTSYCAHVDVYTETAGGDVVGEKTGDAAIRACTGGVLAGDTVFSGDYTCRNFDSLLGFFFENGAIVPEENLSFDRNWGYCSPVEEGLGECSGLIKEDFVEALDGDGVDDNPDYCLSAEDLNEDGMMNDLDVAKCPLGCVSTETYHEWFADMAATASGRKRLEKLITIEATEKGLMVNGLIANGTAGLVR